jgi:hypothetical protein
MRTANKGGTVKAMCLSLTREHIVVGCLLQTLVWAVAEFKGRAVSEFLSACERVLCSQAGSVCMYTLLYDATVWAVKAPGETIRLKLESGSGGEWIFDVGFDGEVTYIGAEDNHVFDPFQLVFDKRLSYHEIRFIPVEYE